MAAWHRSRRADLGLRASGLLLCWLSYTVLARLVAIHTPAQAAGVLAYGLAAVGFLAASGGIGMLFFGHHLFDEIEVSARWRPKPDFTFLYPPEGIDGCCQTNHIMVNSDASTIKRRLASAIR